MDHPLFIQMALEHDQVKVYLKNLETLTSRQELKDLTQTLWKSVIETHHYKEETLLFKYINQKTRITEGGPSCSLYFGFHLMEKFKETVESITQKPLSIESHQMDILNSKTPLIIPLEEHRGGKDLLSFIINNHDQLDIEIIKKHLQIFKTHLLGHILKEENCLYPMCTNLLTEQEADEIYKLWRLG